MSSGQSQPTAAAKLAELGLQLDPTIPYHLEMLFPQTTGWGAKSAIKAKHKLIQRVERQMKSMLRPGEEVLYVAKGVQYSFAEQYFMGWLSVLINQTVFVLTNLRLIMLHSNTKGQPGHTSWTIFYNQIEKFTPSWTGQVVLKLRDGLTLKFTGFPKTDRKQMPAVFQQALAEYQTAGFNPAVSQSRENLCSHCFQIVPKDQYGCEKCGTQFWKPAELALRSYLFPSWGDFLMGHTSAAIFELIGYAVTWLIFAVLIASSFSEQPIDEAIFTLVFVFLLVALEHAVDGTLTYFIAKKGLTPRKRK